MADIIIRYRDVEWLILDYWVEDTTYYGRAYCKLNSSTSDAVGHPVYIERGKSSIAVINEEFAADQSIVLPTSPN